MKKLTCDRTYLVDILTKLLRAPSPSGYTDNIVHFVGEELQRIGVKFELTRRGAIRARIEARVSEPGRALVAHLDTLGAMVKQLKPNGRLEVVPIGTWSSRFAEGARVTIFTETGSHRGTIVPLKASGHIFDKEVDTQPTSWQHVEVRVDERCHGLDDFPRLGIGVGDFVAIDAAPEVTGTGFIQSRHLDDKAGVAVLLTAARALMAAGVTVPVDCYLLFTIFEEVGTGASTTLHGKVAELVGVDNSLIGQGQNSCAYGVTIAMMDASGPFDYHLSRKLIDLCAKHDIEHTRDVYANYRCDAASAIEAGNDIRTALVSFGLDASHGYERTHLDSLEALFHLLTLYMQSPVTFQRDRETMGPLKGFPEQPT